MTVYKLNSDKEVSINIKRYLIDWKNDGDSKLEKKFIDLIYPFWNRYIVLFQCRVPGSKLRLDILNCNKRLAIEIDGEQHQQFNKHFHANSRIVYLNSLRRDWVKEEWLAKNNIKLIRLNTEDLNNFSLKYVRDKFDISLV